MPGALTRGAAKGALRAGPRIVPAAPTTCKICRAYAGARQADVVEAGQDSGDDGHSRSEGIPAGSAAAQQAALFPRLRRGLLAGDGGAGRSFLLAYALCWLIAGNALATIFASAGPVYYEALGFGDTFVLLMAELRAIDEVAPVWALNVQDLRGNATPAARISASRPSPACISPPARSSCLTASAIRAGPAGRSPSFSG